ncbi:uncharacterized protein LOC122500470 [Leptopilina heterotoma]|uniref:uncharacterized protein LOC122500470 n=1 Tax=Leptopilina heterotoma TaxID=63436 RepID=UPI001CA891CA|nr:uncharacterized protein LOC122500470 [Leptopilina heterotoma]
MSDMEMDDSIEYCTPPEIRNAAEEAKASSLPKKSFPIYNLAYKKFMDWRAEKKLEHFSENVLLAYMKHLSETKAPTTLWSVYSILRSTLNVNNNIKIEGYINLRAFLKAKYKGFKPKKSSALTSDQVRQFLLEAPDDKFLAMKVAMLIGVYGACRLEEITNLSVKDIEIQGTLMLINVPKTKTDTPRSFVIGGKNLELITKYQSLRQANTSTDRFFLCYRNEKCTSQPIGRNSFAKMPQIIAQYLKLPNPKTFTGHCFRRTSATLLANSGASMTDMMRHGAWKSPAVVEGYIADSVHQKTKTMSKIGSEINLPSTSNANQFQKSGVMESDSNNNGCRNSFADGENHQKPIGENESNSDSPRQFDLEFSFPELDEAIQETCVETNKIRNSLNQVNTNVSEANSVNKVLSGQDIQLHLTSCSNINIHIHSHKMCYTKHCVHFMQKEPFPASLIAAVATLEQQLTNSPENGFFPHLVHNVLFLIYKTREIYCVDKRCCFDRERQSEKNGLASWASRRNNIGRDGQIRVCLIKTKNGLFKRPVQRIYPLETPIGENEPCIKSIKCEPLVDQVDDLLEAKENSNKSFQNNEIVTTKSGRISKKPDRLKY